MLRFAEELLLLLVDKEKGNLVPVPNRSLRSALAGAVLMDLALENRIDTDLEHLFLVDPTPVGDDLLDPCLAIIASTGDPRDAAHWVERFAKPAVADEMRDQALDRLVKRRILEQDSENLLALARKVARTRRYPMVDSEAEREVELRIMGVLFNDDVPNPRDVMLISLVDACGLFERLLSRAERAEVMERLDLIRHLDLIGRSVFQAIRKTGVSDADVRRKRAKGASSREKRARALATQPRADGGGLPIAGNAFNMAGDMVAYLADQYRKLGPVFRVRAFSHAYTVLAGPEANMFLQREGNQHLRSLKPFAGLTEGFGAHRFILSMDGSEHFRLRKILKDGYSHAFILKRIGLAADLATRAIDDWPEGEPITVLPAVRRIITEQIATLCAGTSPEGYVDDLTYYLDQLLTTRLLHRRPELMVHTPRFRRARDRVERLYETVLDAHKPELRAGKEPDLIDDVLELHRTDPQFLPESDLLPACIGPFIAGLHTAASIATFMLYSVLKHPETLTRMRPEVDELFANRGPTPEKLRAMDVTHRVVLETLRMYRVAPVALRQAVNTFEFAGHTIPAGTSLMFATTVPHLLPEYFPEPERFDIDRYTPDRAEHRAPGVYAPFGLGTHRCLGNGFAEVQLAVTIATMFHRADIALDPPDYKLKINYTPVPSADSGFKIKVVRHR